MQVLFHNRNQKKMQDTSRSLMTKLTCCWTKYHFQDIWFTLMAHTQKKKEKEQLEASSLMVHESFSAGAFTSKNILHLLMPKQELC